MVSLCGGIFLVGFILKVLEAEPSTVGLIASLPMFANLVQIFGAYIIEKTGKNKLLCIFSIAASRTLWIAIILLPFKVFDPVGDYRVWVVVGVIGLSSLFASLAGVGWVSWMSEIVPADIRGTYFGKRNMISSFFGMIFILLGGWFINMWEAKYPENISIGFIIVFTFGLAAGLLSLLFLRAVPPAPPKKPKEAKSFSLSGFLSPFRDKNFIKLILYVSVWIFAVNLAAPFYGVYMINILRIDFSTLTFFGTAATLATLVMMKIWGPITDKLGNKPVVIISTLVLAAVPFIWIPATTSYYYLPVMVAHILTGAFMAGAGLSQFNILIKLSPQFGRSVFLALYASVTGFTGAIAPLAGGTLSETLGKFSPVIFGYTLTGFHLLFLISSILLILSSLLAWKINEEGSATPMAVVLQLKNDLNLQAGISSTSDFILVKASRGENLLKKIDQKTDDLAGRSENNIRKTLDKGGKIIEKPVKKMKDFLKEDK